MNKGDIAERFCGDSRIAKNRDINHLLYLLPSSWKLTAALRGFPAIARLSCMLWIFLYGKLKR